MNMQLHLRLALSSLLFILVIFLLVGCSIPSTKSPLLEEARHAKAKSINHVVLVWFKQGTTPADIAEVIRETNKLPLAIPQIKTMRLGTAITSERSIVDDSFDLGIYFLFDNQQDLQIYLKHPKHVAFVNQFVKPRLAKLVVYDF